MYVRFAFPTVVDGFVRVYVFACGSAATRYLRQSARYSSVPTARITPSRAPLLAAAVLHGSYVYVALCAQFYVSKRHVKENTEKTNERASKSRKSCAK